MTHVLVLTADPAAAALDHSIVEDCLRAADRDPSAGGVRWLCKHVAAEAALPHGLADGALERVRSVADRHGVDANLVPARNRRKKLLVADMESTLIENEMLDDLAAMTGVGAEVAAITRRAMNDELDFRDALRERVALLAGLPIERMEEAAQGIRLTPGAAALVRTMRAHGAYTAIVSGGFLFFTSLVRRMLGADYDEGNDLEIAAGQLTGEVREPVLNRDGKLDALKRIAGQRGLALEDTITVGDGANDVPMLLAAGLGVAFRAKPVVAQAVRLRIAHGDLTGLLYLQGYRRDEFADG